MSLTLATISLIFFRFWSSFLFVSAFSAAAALAAAAVSFFVSMIALMMSALVKSFLESPVLTLEDSFVDVTDEKKVVEEVLEITDVIGFADVTDLTDSVVLEDFFADVTDEEIADLADVTVVEVVTEITNVQGIADFTVVNDPVSWTGVFITEVLENIVEVEEQISEIFLSSRLQPASESY